MGRHSLEDQTVFWRSAVLFGLKWLAIGVLPLLVILGVVRLVTQDEQQVETLPLASSPSPSPEPATEPAVTETAEEEETEETSPTPTPTADAKPSIQVLNGSNTEGRGNVAATELRKEGYEVVAVQNAARKYEKTTVFYQAGYERQANEIARLLGAEVVEPAPDNLDKSIPVTVVVGDDYKP